MVLNDYGLEGEIYEHFIYSYVFDVDLIMIPFADLKTIGNV